MSSDLVQEILAAPIQLADQVIKSASEAASFKQECSDIKQKTEKLTLLLRQAARASNDLYERPTRRILDDTGQVLTKALHLVSKCRNTGLVKRMFTIIPTAAFRKMSSQLENSIGDVSWLLRVSAPDRNDDPLGLPPIAANEPILGLIWEQIAVLYTGSIDDRTDAAASLVSLARDNDRYGKLIIEEGGVGPLLKLVKEGKVEGQEYAARAIGLLGKDDESVEHMIHSGVCSVFTKILKDGGAMKVQSVVAWAVGELARHYPKCQDLFAQHNIIRLLVSHLAFETVQEHSKYSVFSINKATSMHQAVVLASGGGTNNSISSSNRGGNDHFDDDKNLISHPFINLNNGGGGGGGNKNSNNKYSSNNQMHNVVASTMALKSGQAHVSNQHQSSGLSVHGASNRVREMEDPATKAYMKAMAARALWHLARGNSPICKSITESRALLCFAVLLEKGAEEVQYNSAMALMEITAVAEMDADLRRSAFKPNSPACKAVVDQLFSVINDPDSELLIPCIKAIGNLARTFRATETRMISPLVKFLDECEPEVSREACVALTKFACSDNYLHLDHSKAIIKAGGAKHLVQLVYFGESVQSAALILLCYIALHVPDSEELAQVEVLAVLEWASKQAALMQIEEVFNLLPDCKAKLELYQSRGSRPYH